MISSDDVRAVLDLVKRPADYQYFFENLTSPEWLPHLAAAGFFEKPPALIRDEGTARAPFWPESKYLVRIAGTEPEAVVDVIKNASLRPKIIAFRKTSWKRAPGCRQLIRRN